MSTWVRPWRYGHRNELELDSLADRLLCNPDLRTDIQERRVTVRKQEFMARVIALSDKTGTPFTEQLAAVIERATEHTIHHTTTSKEAATA